MTSYGGNANDIRSPLAEPTKLIRCHWLAVRITVPDPLCRYFHTCLKLISNNCCIGFRWLWMDKELGLLWTSHLQRNSMNAWQNFANFTPHSVLPLWYWLFHTIICPALWKCVI